MLPLHSFLISLNSYRMKKFIAIFTVVLVVLLGFSLYRCSHRTSVDGSTEGTEELVPQLEMKFNKIPVFNQTLSGNEVHTLVGMFKNNFISPDLLIDLQDEALRVEKSGAKRTYNYAGFTCEVTFDDTYVDILLYNKDMSFHLTNYKKADLYNQ